jgi:5-methylcytosine-specific restriction enzyme A
MASLSDVLNRALAHLPEALDQPFTGHPLGDLLVRDATEALEPLVPGSGYKRQGSRGRGRWAETVWVSVFDRLVTETAQGGYYVVYLFRRDGDAIYLSLNQGTTAVHDEVGGRRYLGVLQDRATVYAGLIKAAGVGGLEQGPIDLGGGGRLTRGYEAGNVAARRDDRGSIPNDEQLAADLARHLDLYVRLVEANDHLAEADTPDEDDDASPPEPDWEAKRLRWHLRAERNPRLVAEAKRYHGTQCMACNFDFADRYGELGEGYCEAHHLTPIAELEGRPTKLDPRHDFAVVCANCHRVIHRRRPPYTLAEVKAVLN